MSVWMKNCKSQWKAAFAGAFIAGLLCYFYTMSHHFLTYDSMWNLYSDQDMISSGRQFLMYACSIGSYYDLPAINGFLAILYLAITAVVLVEVFRIQTNMAAFLTGGLLVAFPSVASTFCYSFTVDGYMLAVLLITLGFFLTDKYKWGFAGGIVLTGVSIGIYQAYYAYLIVLSLLMLLLYLLEEKELKTILFKGLRYMASGIGGYLFYVVSLKIMLAGKGANLSGYQGTDKVLQFSFGQILKGAKVAFQTFYHFVTWENVLTTTFAMKASFVALIVCGAAFYVYGFLKNKCYKSILRLVLTVVCVVCIPFGSNVINLLSPEVTFHLLMRYSWVLFFVFILVLAEKYHGMIRMPKVGNIMVAAVEIFSVILIFEFAVMANVVAFNMEERYEKTYALCVRIVDRLEQTEGYETGMPVAVLGGFPSQEYYPATSITENDLVGYFGSNGEYCVNSTQKMAEFCSHYLNVTLTTVSDEEEIRIAGSDEFMEMEKFPSKECIQLIDGIWVIKLNG